MTNEYNDSFVRAVQERGAKLRTLRVISRTTLTPSKERVTIGFRGKAVDFLVWTEAFTNPRTGRPVRYGYVMEEHSTRIGRGRYVDWANLDLRPEFDWRNNADKALMLALR